ncbi:MAG: HAD family phosphatase [Lachnospiraceae bacterium]|jgi:Cof subfamily protein (haloacid dehalogenase superfamily)|nr:HAD family phosphatase [Lachnospiraceae bacterium]
MDIRLIALDLDGTLLDNEKKLSAGNLAALTYCIQHGIEIVPATGRPASGIPDFVRNIPGVRYGILTNGARVEDLVNGTVISEQLIDWKLAYEILSLLSHYPVAYDPYIGGRGKMEPRFRNHLEQYGLPPVMQQLVLCTRDEVEDELKYVSEKKGYIEKINIFTADPQLRMELWTLLKKYSELIVTSSLDYNLEINAVSATKGEGLASLASHLGLGLNETMAFGDGSNDFSMIKTAGIGVAMANAMDILKEQADYITLSNDNDGVAAAIWHFLKSSV